MSARKLFKKFLFLFIIFMSFSSFVMVGYSIWDSVASSQPESLSVGDWGTPITTAQEFYDFATKTDSVATDKYYLFNDIDFSGFTWNLNDTNNNVTFYGVLDGNHKTISNLTIYTNSNTYTYIGIFPRIEGGKIYNLTLDNVNISLGSTALAGTSLIAGLLTADVRGLTNNINNITIIDSAVRGTNSVGVGGLIGSVRGATTIVNIDNIKTSNLKVFNTRAKVGGIIGNIKTGGAQVILSDIDIQGELFSANKLSYTGGVVGNINSDGILYLSRAVVDMTTQNTLETSVGYLTYSQKYLGGLIGQNKSTSDKVILTDTFFTGSLFTNAKKFAKYIGTAVGRDRGSVTLNSSFYSMVEFTSQSGSSTYTPYLPIGVMSTVVNASSMPNNSWWNGFATSFNAANSLWNQDSSGRLYLIRN